MTKILLILLAAIQCAAAGAALAFGYCDYMGMGEAILLAIFSTGSAVLAVTEIKGAI